MAALGQSLLLSGAGQMAGFETGSERMRIHRIIGSQNNFGNRRDLERND